MVFGLTSNRRRKPVPNTPLKAGLHGFYQSLQTYCRHSYQNHNRINDLNSQHAKHNSCSVAARRAEKHSCKSSYYDYYRELVCLLLNGTSAQFRPLVPRIVEIEHSNHVKNDLK